MTLPPRSYAKKGRDVGLRSPAHRKFVGQHLCILWERKDCEGPVDCCHARDIAPRTGGKPGDQWCVAMCRKHHRESEKNEHAWGYDNGVDVEAMCLEFATLSPDRAIREAARLYITNRGPSPQVTTATVPRFPPESAEGPSPTSLQRQT